MKILAFAPYAAIWQHAYPEAVTLEALANKNHSVDYICCDGIMSGYCISMSGIGVKPSDYPERKKRACEECRIKRDIIKNSGLS